MQVVTAQSENYQNLRDFERAREFLDIAEAINPLSTRYLFTAGQVQYAIDGDPVAAVRYWSHDKNSMRFEIWRANAAMGDFDLSQDFEVFNADFTLGEVRLLPELMQGMSLRLAGDPAGAKPYLDQAIENYRGFLQEDPDEFKILKPLCWAAGAANAAGEAKKICQQALEHLPDDAWDRNYHRGDIAGGLAMAGLNAEALALIAGVLSDRSGPSRVELQLDPMLRSLHDEPRWQAVMAKRDGAH